MLDRLLAAYLVIGVIGAGCLVFFFDLLLHGRGRQTWPLVGLVVAYIVFCYCSLATIFHLAWKYSPPL